MENIEALRREFVEAFTTVSSIKLGLERAIIDFFSFKPSNSINFDDVEISSEVMNVLKMKGIVAFGIDRHAYFENTEGKRLYRPEWEFYETFAIFSALDELIEQEKKGELNWGMSCSLN